MLAICLAMLDEPSDKERFIRLYNKYSDFMYRVAFSMLRNQELAFDSVQNAFISIAKNIKTLPSENESDHEQAYVITCVKHSAINVGKKASSRIYTLELQEFSGVSSEYSPLDSLVMEESVQNLILVIEKMPETYRDILILKYVNGLSCVEISKHLSIPYNTVKSKALRGTLILQESVRKSMKQ